MAEAVLDRDETAAALEDADLRVLSMVMRHLTDDPKWSAPPFAPARDIRLIPPEDAGLSPEAQAALREAALDRLTAGPLRPAFDDPGPARMAEMMQACLGERVPDEYGVMMREEMGFLTRRRAWRAADGALKAPVLIVGAGASGLALGAELEAAGLPYLIIEKNGEVGGAWYENRYPGCAVDTPNHAYSYSHGAREDWSRYFSPQPEILAYLIQRSHDFALRPQIRFKTRMTGAVWDEAEKLWRIGLEGPSGSETVTAAALVSAIGPLSDPKLARFDGDERFKGAMFHSARWPQDLSLAGKRVAVIGTGASSMQISPAIAGEVESLTIYQRTPQWAREIPRFKEAMRPGARWLLRHVPYYAAWFRFTMLWRYGDGLLRTLKRDPDWAHPDRSMNRINERHRVEMERFIARELEGRPDLLAKAMPDYPPYGKRILLDNGWFRTLRRENVELVADPIQRITETGVVAGDVAREADVIVLATGFEVTQGAARLGLTGRGGVDLADQWAPEDPRAYLGITAPNFPNFFVLQGPGTGLAHGGSAIFTSECQIRYVTGCLQRMAEDGIAAMEVREDVHDAYMDRLDAEHRELVWAHPAHNTYYRNRFGRVISIIPWRLVDYWAMTREVDLADYVLT